MSVAKVSTLTYYPVKGLAGVSVDRADVGRTGLRHDRSLMLVEPDGTFLSQRVVPVMAPLRAEVLADGDGLRLSDGSSEPLEIEVAYDGKNYIPWAWLNLEGGDNINLLPTC